MTKTKTTKTRSKRTKTAPTPSDHDSVGQRLEPGTPVFVRWDASWNLKLGLLVKRTRDDRPVVRVLRVDRSGAYIPEFGSERTFEPSEVSRVYSRRDWESMDVMLRDGHASAPESARGHDERIADGPATDEMQHRSPRHEPPPANVPPPEPPRPVPDKYLTPELRAQRDAGRSIAFEVGQVINVRIPRSSQWEGVKITTFDAKLIHFVAGDGTDGVVKWSDEGTRWFNPRKPESIALAREKSGRAAANVARLEGEREQIKATGAVTFDEVEAARAAERERQEVDEQGQRALAQANGHEKPKRSRSRKPNGAAPRKTKESALDRAVAQAEREGRTMAIPATHAEVDARAANARMMGVDYAEHEREERAMADEAHGRGPFVELGDSIPEIPPPFDDGFDDTPPWEVA